MSGRYRHKKKRLSTTAIISILILTVLVYAGILLGVKLVGSRLETSDTQETVGSLEGRFSSTNRPTKEIGGKTLTYRDLTNILLIGTDWDEDEPDNYRHYAGQSDFLLLLTIDKKNKTVSALHLDRDTVADVRTYGPFGDYTGAIQTQLCMAYSYGGTKEKNCENAVWSVSRLLGGLKIDGYVTMDMKSIALFNDALGGVTVTLEDDMSARDPAMVKGATVTLHGDMAEYFVRARKGVGDGLNTSRMRRQRQFMEAAEQLLLSGMREDMSFAGRVYDAMAGHIGTDLGRGWLINKAYECSSYSFSEIRTPVGEHLIGEEGYMEFHPDGEALESLITTLFYE